MEGISYRGNQFSSQWSASDSLMQLDLENLEDILPASQPTPMSHATSHKKAKLRICDNLQANRWWHATKSGFAEFYGQYAKKARALARQEPVDATVLEDAWHTPW